MAKHATLHHLKTMASFSLLGTATVGSMGHHGVSLPMALLGAGLGLALGGWALRRSPVTALDSQRTARRSTFNN